MVVRQVRAKRRRQRPFPGLLPLSPGTCRAVPAPRSPQRLDAWKRPQPVLPRSLTAGCHARLCAHVHPQATPSPRAAMLQRTCPAWSPPRASRTGDRLAAGRLRAWILCWGGGSWGTLQLGPPHFSSTPSEAHRVVLDELPQPDHREVRRDGDKAPTLEWIGGGSAVRPATARPGACTFPSLPRARWLAFAP